MVRKQKKEQEETHVDREGEEGSRGRVQENEAQGRTSPRKPHTGLTLSPYQLKRDYRGPWTVSYGQIRIPEGQLLLFLNVINLLLSLSTTLLTLDQN